MVSVWTSSPGAVTSGRLGLSERTRFFLPRATPDRHRIRRTLLSDTETASTVTRWCHTTSAQRLSCARTPSTRSTSFWLTAVGLVCGREIVVGMRQVQAASRKLLLGCACGRLGRLSLVSWMFWFSASHLRFQRQTVLRWTPQRLATICRGTQSRTSNCMAIALALGRLGLVE